VIVLVGILEQSRISSLFSLLFLFGLIKKFYSKDAIDLGTDPVEDTALLAEAASKKSSKKSKKPKKAATAEDEDAQPADLDQEPPVLVKKPLKISNLYAKTPSRIDTGRSNTKTPSTLRISQSILRKSIRHSISKANGRPLTRRAAAEAAAKKTKITSSNAGYTVEGEVRKPMNPVVSALRNCTEAKGSPIKKLIGKFESISRTPIADTPTNKRLGLDTGTPKTNGRIKVGCLNEIYRILVGFNLFLINSESWYYKYIFLDLKV
jgi:hypothetical protein